MCTVCKSPSTLRLRRVAAAHASQVTVDRCALRRTVERAAHRPMPLQIAGAGWAGYPCQQPRPRRWIFATFGLWPAPPRLFGVSRGGRHDRLPVEGFVSPYVCSGSMVLDASAFSAAAAASESQELWDGHAQRCISC